MNKTPKPNVPCRAVGIVIYQKQILLMDRNNLGEKYLVFPGGGVEDGEVIEDAVLRELKEETSANFSLKRLLYIHDYGSSQQYFYLCQYLGGKIQLQPDSIEQIAMQNNKNDFYQPKWIPLKKIQTLLVYPLEIRDWLLADLNNGFSTEVKKAKIKLNQIRQTL